MQVKTINLTGEETKIEFDKTYSFVEINNLSGNEILVSTKPEIVRGNDDVIIISAKTIATIGDTGYAGIKEIYASGSGEIQLIAKNYAEHCFKLPASGGNSDDPKDKHFQLIGSGGIFDASSIDISNKVWKNLADGNDITWETDGVTVDGDLVHFTNTDYGKYETPRVNTIYCIFKCASLSGDVPVIGGWYSSASNDSEFGIVMSSGNIYLVGNGNNMRSVISASHQFTVVAITKSDDGRGTLYINGIRYGYVDGLLDKTNYKDIYFINSLSRSSSGSIASGYNRTDVDFKFIAFDTKCHSEDLVVKNTKSLIDYIS